MGLGAGEKVVSGTFCCCSAVRPFKARGDGERVELGRGREDQAWEGVEMGAASDWGTHHGAPQFCAHTKVILPGVRELCCVGV